MSSIADNIRRNIERQRQTKTSEEELLDAVNDTSRLLVNKFLANVQAGAVELTDVTDLVRVINLASEINGWRSGEHGGSGTLPAISIKQADILDNTIQTTKTVIDGEEKDVIDLNSLESLTDDSIHKMLQEREITYNQENEATF